MWDIERMAFDQKKKKKANSLLMQTISDSNGCRQGVIAISVGTIAGFPSVHIHLSEKLKVSFVSHFSLHWIVSTNAFFGKMFFWRLVETKRFGVLIHPRGPLSSDCATHPLWSRIQVWLLELQILPFFSSVVNYQKSSC